jgi:hypothetical protein
VSRFGNALTLSQQLPSFVNEIPTPKGIVLASNYHYNPVHELEGDIQALRLVDLDREGLSQYRPQLNKLNNIILNTINSTNDYSTKYSTNGLIPSVFSSDSTHSDYHSGPLPFSYQSNIAVSVNKPPGSVGSYNIPYIPQPTQPPVQQVLADSSYPAAAVAAASCQISRTESFDTDYFLTNELKEEFIVNVFKTIDTTESGRITAPELEKILLNLNSRLGRRYGEDDVKALFNTLDINNDGSIDFDEFKKAFFDLNI